MQHRAAVMTKTMSSLALHGEPLGHQKEDRALQDMVSTDTMSKEHAPGRVLPNFRVCGVCSFQLLEDQNLCQDFHVR
jgi:hypothetical protein